jgi:glycerol kinase
VCDLLYAMEKDSCLTISAMRCDGGAVANNFLMQFQADILGIPVLLPEITEATAHGAAFMAAIGAGYAASLSDLKNHWRLARTFEPKMSMDERSHLLTRWHRAVERAKSWEQE